MDRLRRRMICAGIAVSAVGLAGGCVTTTTSETAPPRVQDVPPPSFTMPSVPSLSTMIEGEKPTKVTEMAVMWMNRVAYLPDPTRNGRPGAGLAGQLVLLGPNLQFAQVDGTLTVDVYDETPRQPGGPAALTPERWQYTAADLKKLASADERFGMTYTLFLPWVAYRPDVTRVRIMARYDPADGSHPLFAPASTLTIDTTPQNGSSVWSGGTTTTVPVVK